MGKATITGGGTDGQYNVTLEYDTAMVEALITQCASRIASLDAYIATLDAGEKRDRAQLERESIQVRKTRLETYRDAAQADTRTVWCADLTENLSTGEVATIEVPGEPETVLIRPAYSGDFTYDAARDGQLQRPEAGTPAGTYWNLAMLPAWQRHMPTYRTGTITALDGDTCDVTLDAATSTQQSLDVNDRTTLSSVPIDYMNCDGGAFDVGDEVVVEFAGQSWDSPTVIGFKSHPKGCGWFFRLTHGDGRLVDDTMNLVVRIYPATGLRTSKSHTKTYDAATGYWNIVLDDPIGDADPDGFWVEYRCDDANLWVQWPERYTEGTQRQAADAIQPDGEEREDYCHYYYREHFGENWGYTKISGCDYRSLDINPLDRPIDWNEFDNDTIMDSSSNQQYAGNYEVVFKRNGSVRIGESIKSSVPVYVKAVIRGCPMVSGDNCPGISIPEELEAYYDISGWAVNGISGYEGCLDPATWIVLGWPTEYLTRYPTHDPDQKPLAADVVDQTDMYYAFNMRIGGPGARLQIGIADDEEADTHTYTAESAAATIQSNIGTSPAYYTDAAVELTCISEESGSFNCYYDATSTNDTKTGNHNYTYAELLNEIVDITITYDTDDL